MLTQLCTHPTPYRLIYIHSKQQFSYQKYLLDIILLINHVPQAAMNSSKLKNKFNITKRGQWFLSRESRVILDVHLRAIDPI